MDSIEQLSNSFLETAKKKDLQDFCEKQFRQLLEITQENKRLLEEVDHLKKLLNNEVLLIEPAHKITNEEAICLQQIEKLKQISDSAELTLEESKKLDTFVKLIKIIRSKDNTSGFLKEFKTEDLMKLVEHGDNK